MRPLVALAFLLFAPANPAFAQDEPQPSQRHATLSVATNAMPVFGQFALVDVRVQTDGPVQLMVYVHTGGAACASEVGEEEQAASGRRVRVIAGRDERMAFVPDAGSWVVSGRYVPHQFAAIDRLCVYAVDPNDPMPGVRAIARAEAAPLIRFGLPWGGAWWTPSRGAVRDTRQNLRSLSTPQQPGYRPGGPTRIDVHGTWGCDVHANPFLGRLNGRRWDLRGVPVGSDRRFAYEGRVRADHSGNYDSPKPRPWPSRVVRVRLSGRFLAGPVNRHSDGGGNWRISGRLTVITGGRRCARRLTLRGYAAASALSPALDERYGPSMRVRRD